MWLNILGVAFSLIFYLSVLFRASGPAAQVRNPARDTLLVVDHKIQWQLRQLQRGQDSLLKSLYTAKTELQVRQTQVLRSKQRIHLLIQSDWDSLSPKVRQRYTERVIQKLKKKK